MRYLQPPYKYLQVKKWKILFHVCHADKKLGVYSIIFIFLSRQLNYRLIFFLWRIFFSHSQKTYPQLTEIDPIQKLFCCSCCRLPNSSEESSILLWMRTLCTTVTTNSDQNIHSSSSCYITLPVPRSVSFFSSLSNQKQNCKYVSIFCKKKKFGEWCRHLWICDECSKTFSSREVVQTVSIFFYQDGWTSYLLKRI